MTLSLVLAVRDRAEQLALCLHTLEHQTVPAADYEVVVVDDGSGPAVRALLSRLHPAHALTVVRRETSTGRAAARNAGWQAASGDAVVFLDADILAAPTLADTHRRLHAEHAGPAPLVVSGCPWLWRSIFTVDYPGFSAAQRAALGRPVPPQQPTPLLAPDEAAARAAEILETAAGNPGPVRRFPDDGAPFLAFVTRDVSVHRDVVRDIGGFWEGFSRYGLADWELGYRLYRSGAHFVAARDASCIHQEHPTGSGRGADNLYNYGLVLDRHPHPEIALMAVCSPWVDQGAYARLCTGYHRLALTAPAWRPDLDEELLTHARKWAAWAASGRGPAPTCALPPPRDTEAALAMWRAWRDPETAQLLRTLDDAGR